MLVKLSPLIINDKLLLGVGGKEIHAEFHPVDRLAIHTNCGGIPPLQGAHGSRHSGAGAFWRGYARHPAGQFQGSGKKHIAQVGAFVLFSSPGHFSHGR